MSTLDFPLYGALQTQLEAGSLRPLEARLQELDLPPGALWLAAELALLADSKISQTKRSTSAACARRSRLQQAARSPYAHLVLALLLAEQQGSSFVPFEGPGGLRELLRALGLSPAALRAALEAAGAPAASASEKTRPSAIEAFGGVDRPLLRTPEGLGLHRNLVAETCLAQLLGARLAQADVVAEAPDSALERALAEAVAQQGPHGPSPSQQAACAAALARPLTIITGGPGTGKTTIIATLLATLHRLQSTQPRGGKSGELGGPSTGTHSVVPFAPFAQVALAAPTGKAADRLAQSLNQQRGALFEPSLRLPSAETVHRLLAFSPRRGRFLRHEHNPLAARFVIIDEASMIDLELMTALLRAIPPEAHLVLLGDAEQLPPVGAGAVLRDLVAAPLMKDVVFRLETSYRMDSNDPAGASILAAAEALKAGKLDALLGRAAPLDSPAASKQSGEDWPAISPGAGAGNKATPKASFRRGAQDPVQGELGFGPQRETSSDPNTPEVQNNAGRTSTSRATSEASAPPSEGLLAQREHPDALSYSGAELLLAPSKLSLETFLRHWLARHLILAPEDQALTNACLLLDANGRLLGSEADVNLEAALNQRDRVPETSAQSAQQTSATQGLGAASIELRLRALIDHTTKSKLLCVTRVPAGGAGAEAVNASLLRLLRRTSGVETMRGRELPLPLPLGCLMMVTQNDYEHGLYNGDTGLLLRARRAAPQAVAAAGSGQEPDLGAQQAVLLFARAGGLQLVNYASIATRVEPAYAVTVHKAQGSEYDEVAILLPKYKVRTATRALLYTALTRARRSAIVVGTATSLKEALGQNAIRNTHLPRSLMNLR